MSHFQSEFGGVLAPGLLGTNGATQLPELKNRSVSVGQLNQVSYTYEATDVNTPDDHKVVIYLDSKQDGVADDSTGYQTTPIAATGHDLEALVLDLQDAPPVYISARACGRRVRLSWPRSTDADLAAYKLYWNEGDGSTTTELTTISTVSASPVVSVDGGSGGLGSLQGVYRGPVTNATWQVEIVSVSSRTARYNNGTGWTSISFEPEQMFNLESGLRFIFESKVGDYSDGDIWSFTVGPETVFVTDELDEDTYAFALAGIDQAGNESTKSSDVSATVTHEPDAPTAFAVTYDDTDFSLSWTNAAGVTGTKIYSNYDPAFGVLRDYVLEQNPIATITSPTAVATINAAGLDGTALFYARHYDATTEEDNCNLVTVECGNTIASAVLPPFDLSGVPSAGGKALLSWSYTVGDVEPDLFNVYEFTSEPSLADINGASPLDTVSFTAGAIYQEFSFETSALAGQRWYVVRSQADSVEELNAVSVAVTPDSTAPSITTLSAQVVC